MKIINGKLISKELTFYYSGYFRNNRHDILLLAIEGTREKIAISYFSETEAINDSAYSKIDIGKVYTFYLDPSYPIVNYQNSGLSIIDYEGKEIYRKKNSVNLYIGLFFVLLGIAITYFGIKKNRSKNGG